MVKEWRELFLWGAATSSHQIEGHNEHNDWAFWEKKGFVKNGVVSGAATDHWNRFKEDIQLAADLGLNSYRFSIEWSRIEPTDGRWNSKALDWYRALIAECEKHQLIPMATLHHFTNPQWFAKRGSFCWEESPLRFARYTRLVAAALGKRVPIWCTINEPMVMVVASYIAKFMPPAEFSPAKASLACHNLLKSHVAAYQILHQIGRRQGPFKDLPLMVGCAHNLMDFHPSRQWHPQERLFTRIFHRFYNQAWLDAITGRGQPFGIPMIFPAPPKVQEAVGVKTADFIGVNYYTKAHLCWGRSQNGAFSSKELPLGIEFVRSGEKKSDVGWAIHPQGLSRMLRFAAQYKLPLYVTENGIADQNDRMRPSFLLSHLRSIAHARRHEIDVRGYYHWSLLDNFEWIEGFAPRFGLYSVDYKTFARSERRSASVYREVIREHEHKPPDLKILDLFIPYCFENSSDRTLPSEAPGGNEPKMKASVDAISDTRASDP